jgi:hypothetical protein
MIELTADANECKVITIVGVDEDSVEIEQHWTMAKNKLSQIKFLREGEIIRDLFSFAREMIIH